jgi:VCBS repeat-containing protein
MVSNQGEVVISLLVVAGLVLLAAAGSMLTQYVRTQVLTPEQEIQKTFKYTVPNEAALIGEHSLQFTATDGIDTFTSDPVTVVVTAKNNPPQVAAGEDITLRLPREASLTGTATDDGLPMVPGETVVSWSKISGPGNVTFGTVNALQTTAAFSAAGTYVIRLTAADGQASAEDDITIIVEAAPPAPDLSLQADRAKLAVGDNLIVSVRLEEATPFANWAQYLSFDRTKLELVDQQSGDFATFIADTRGLSAINASGEVRSGGFSLANNNSGAGNLGIFTFKAVGAGQAVVATANKSASKPFGNALMETDSYEILPDITTAEVSMTILSENTAPAVNAGQDQQIRLPINQVTLNGAMSDDGLPDPPATVTAEWSKVSGPGTVVFADATDLATTAVFSGAGVYVLELAVGDGTLLTTDEMVVTVKAENRPPQATGETYDAWRGEAQQVSVINGVLKNDTDPDNDQLTAQLVDNVQHGELALSANGSFSYTSENDWRGSDSFTYQAFDGVATSETVTVEISVAVRNQAPVVKAGEDQVINLPSPAILLGLVSDDGEPVGQGLQIQWSKKSGPGEILFTDSSLASTSATFSQPGSYTLRLQGGDGELVSFDEAVVSVNTVPVGQDDDYTAYQFEKLTVAAPGVLDNDTDIDNDALSAQLVTQAQHGALQLNADGSFTYTSDRFFAGTDSFTYVVTDSKASSRISMVEIAVIVRNAAPQVSAGSDQIIELGREVPLTGVVTDDGKPGDNGPVNVIWSKMSGPGEVSFLSIDQAATTANFTLAGQYVLRLSASDGELLAADEVTMIVHTAPQVTAGDDFQPLINEVIQLIGTVSDDGLPAGSNELRAEWTVVSGPAGQAEITDTNKAVTEAAFRQDGEYVLRLTANDGNLISYDEVTVKAVSRQATIVIPGQTRLEVRPGQTIEVPFIVKSNILNKARLLLKMTRSIFLSEILE